MINQLDAFYLDQEEPNKSCLMALRHLILGYEPITETMKYGMPCFLLGKRALCYLWRDKQSGDPYILMVEGKQLHHPQLESGNRKRMKILRINPEEDLPLAIIHQVLDEGIRFYQQDL